MNNDLYSRLTQLKTIVQAKTKEWEQSKGRLAQLKEELQKKFNCTSVKDAKQLREKLAKEEKQLKTDLEKGINELETALSEYAN